jgi:cell filamentation protein
VLIVKAGASFCLPHQIESTAADVFGRLAAADHLRERDRTGFLDGLAALLAEVNALHPPEGRGRRTFIASCGWVPGPGLGPPFREGNGRSQHSFLSQLARDAGYRLRWGATRGRAC